MSYPSPAEERDMDAQWEAHQDRLADEADRMDALVAELEEAPPEEPPTIAERLEAVTGLNGRQLLDALEDEGLAVVLADELRDAYQRGYRAAVTGVDP